jgi:serine/threonine protein kinase
VLTPLNCLLPAVVVLQVLAQPSADVIAVRKIKPAQLPSYDCKVDIWALGVLVYEALMGVTPFNDTDSQAACLKAQFRAPLPLPSVSPACADFVTQALAKQAAKRPSAAQLLGHPWVQAHMTSHEAQLYSEQASMQRCVLAACVCGVCCGCAPLCRGVP